MDSGTDANEGPGAGVPAELAGHPDRLRWNAKYESAPEPSFAPHPLAVRALEAAPGGALPDGPVLDLACGQSGSALLAAREGRRVTAVDVSEVALGRLGAQARRRGLDGLITLVQQDLGAWRPGAARYALVLCTGFWDRAVFGRAAAAVAPGGLLAWEALTARARAGRDTPPADWCVGEGEPASLLPGGFAVLEQDDVPGGRKRRLLARAPAAVS
ncbi:class I SAM-dependent DNA methyltransferase [Actinomadura opuntiae]|uniref:class I SAM-dependent DNA methyltransferase n=1 Tax=Actinomadura sp. OS1-43 TaxID=604315 RepID=UPI00255A72EE|nr:class I SAM-dependent methyltransferase [Actinomadura sp. OS1-43]MDL4817769.1 class I SAM-dependent methyltransferase [Actinomadura sp. OS1-43]